MKQTFEFVNVKDLQAQDDLPEFLKKDVCIFGSPGAGKTTLLNIIGEYYKQDKERFKKAQAARVKNGFEPLPEGHCVFSNVADISNYYGGNNCQSYAFDPYKFMMPNKRFRYEQVVAHGVYKISEAQKIYDSYDYQNIPREVYFLYQNRRQIHLRIVLDCQRPKDIAAKIRDIFKLFIRPVEISVKRSIETGIVVSTIVKYLEFTDIQATEKFIEEYGQDEARMLKHPDLKIYEAPFDFRKIFNSFENEKFIYEKPEAFKEKSTWLKRGQIVTFKDINDKYPYYFSTYWEKQEEEKQNKKAA